MKHLLLLLSCFSAITALAQNPKDYFAFPQEQKELVFIDEFDSDDSSWGAEDGVPSEDKDSCIIKDGYFYHNLVDTDNNRNLALPHNTDIDFTRNFEIIVRIKVVQKEKKDYGIVFWGRDGLDLIGHFLFIDHTGAATIYYCNQKSKEQPCGYKQKWIYPYTKKNDFNIYTIRKYKDDYYIFVNGVYKKKSGYVPLTGKHIGLGSNENAEVFVDFLKIYYLPD